MSSSAAARLPDGHEEPRFSPVKDEQKAQALGLTSAMMHLDTVMTMIDRSTFVLYPYRGGPRCMTCPIERDPA